jgi:hypothetical protein
MSLYAPSMIADNIQVRICLILYERAKGFSRMAASFNILALYENFSFSVLSEAFGMALQF